VDPGDLPKTVLSKYSGKPMPIARALLRASLVNRQSKSGDITRGDRIAARLMAHPKLADHAAVNEISISSFYDHSFVGELKQSTFYKDLWR